MSRIPAVEVDAVLERAQGHCEACGRTEAHKMDLHHRMARGMGGSKRHLDVAANLLWLHAACHSDVHANPTRSRQLGHIVPSWERRPLDAVPALLLSALPATCWTAGCDVPGELEYFPGLRGLVLSFPSTTKDANPMSHKCQANCGRMIPDTETRIGCLQHWPMVPEQVRQQLRSGISSVFVAAEHAAIDAMNRVNR